MRECPTLAFVTAFSLITNICSNVTQRRLNLPKHSLRVLEVHTSNISKVFLRTTIMYIRRVASQFFLVSPRDHFFCPVPLFSEMKEIGRRKVLGFHKNW